RVRAGAGGPLVLAGGLLACDTALSHRVRSAAAQRWPEARVTVARDGAAAAAWLAAQRLPTPALSPAELHAALLGT
ncbi:MAG: ATPase, partial [Micromonosporaceae bacterium]